MQTLIVDRQPVDLKKATRDALLSARAHAWVQFFDNQERPAWGVSRRDTAMMAAQMRYDLGIDAIEDELEERGISPKSKDYTKTEASFDLS
tara:strand:- start:2120 stop:2392 length:273 start_codon:yes stop_codon:yes gene_type:complete